MGKTAVAVCSTSGVDYAAEKDQVSVLRLTVHFDGKEYVDHTDITASEFYSKMLEKPNAAVSTSQVSTGQFADLYEKLRDEGITDVLVITLSSKLSGTYQGALLAKGMVEGINVVVFDSRSVSYPEFYIAKKALEFIQLGDSVSEVVTKLEKIRESTHIYVLVDTLKYLVKNGRLSATSGILGTLLKIKPLLVIKQDGSLVPKEKIRTTTKAQKRLLEIVLNDIKDKDVELFIAYTTNLDKAVSIKTEIQGKRPDVKIELVPLTPVVGAHAGPGTLGVGYILL